MNCNWYACAGEAPVCYICFQDATTYPAYTVGYVMYNSACEEYDIDPLMLPTTLTSSPDFPNIDHVRTINEQCVTRKLNVRFYLSITVTVKLSDVQGSDCDVVFVMVN